VTAGDITGVGFTYSDLSAGSIAERVLAPVVRGRNVMDIEARHADMVHAVRNIGLPGVAASAIAAVDVALWDTKARLLDVPLVLLLGAARAAIPIYGSGGFTSYSIDQVQQQLGDWADLVCARSR
jgi:L-alanine-DL-glutamate epimerase-like enolase superfamily enzyme